MKLNNKGFTIVEVLAVIALISILTGIAIISVSRYKEKAVKTDYDALAKSSYNAMEEYLMSHPYEENASLEKLEKDSFLSNRVDPGSKDNNCEGTVIVEKNDGSNSELDNGTYKVYLCCSGYKKMYTYPNGEIQDIDDPSKCNATPSPTGGDSTIICSPGLYLQKSYVVCTQCPNGSYCPGGKFTKDDTKDQGINECPNCYKNSNPGSSLITQCYSKVKQNYHIKTKNECSVACPSGENRNEHNVFYGQKSTCTNKKVKVTFNCSPGKINSGTTSTTRTYESNKSGQKFDVKCTRIGYEQKADKGWKNNKSGTTYKLNSGVSVNFIETNTPSVTLSAIWSKICVTCPAGQYLPKNSTTCKKCTAGSYCPGDNYCYNANSNQGIKACPKCYTNSPTGSSKEKQCYSKVNKNNYVKSANACPVKCPSGQNKDAHEVTYGKISGCNSVSIEATFNCNGGNIKSGNNKVTYKTDEQNQKFTTTCERAHYKQTGWSRNEKGPKHYDTNSNVTENWIRTYTPKTTLYAQWEDIYYKCDAGKYLPKNSTSCSTCTAGSYCPGGKFKFSSSSNQGINACPKCYKNSKEGSSKESQCYANVEKNNYVATANTCPTNCPKGQYKDGPYSVSYGKVSSCAVKSITVTFNCNGGNYNGSKSFKDTFSSNKKDQKFSKKCDKNGYSQDGWKKVKTNKKKDYNTYSNVVENWIVTNSPKITLYAHWNINTYTLKYNDNGGSGCSKKSISKNYNSEWGTLCTPSRTDYIFDGWYKDTTKITNKSKATNDITVTAKWIPPYINQNNEQFTKLQDAINDSDTTTIKLQRDYTDNYSSNFNVNRNIVFNLNGKKLELSKYAIKISKGNVTIKNGTIETSGEISDTITSTGGTLTIAKGANISSRFKTTKEYGTSAIKVSGGIVNLYGKITSGSGASSGYARGAFVESGTFNMYDGAKVLSNATMPRSKDGKGASGINCNAKFDKNGKKIDTGNVNIYGGTVEITMGYINRGVVAANYGKVRIKGKSHLIWKDSMGGGSFFYARGGTLCYEKTVVIDYNDNGNSKFTSGPGTITKKTTCE